MCCCKSSGTAGSDMGDAFPCIESRIGVCGGEPCITRTRIPVRVLEQARRLGINESEILRSYPTLRAEDLAHSMGLRASSSCRNRTADSGK